MEVVLASVNTIFFPYAGKYCEKAVLSGATTVSTNTSSSSEEVVKPSLRRATGTWGGGQSRLHTKVDIISENGVGVIAYISICCHFHSPGSPNREKHHGLSAHNTVSLCFEDNGNQSSFKPNKMQSMCGGLSQGKFRCLSMAKQLTSLFRRLPGLR